MKEVRLSVRQLVEFILQSGDLTSSFSGAKSAERMLEGSRIHRYYQAKQKKENSFYQSEVSFSYQQKYLDIVWDISGRADGLLEEAGQMPIIEEIKSTLLPTHLIEENDYPLHWAQAMCYGYFYLLENDSSEILIKLTYIQVETIETRSFLRTYTKDSLEKNFQHLLNAYAPWANLEIEHCSQRNRSLKELTFPFGNFREGQRALSASVYHSIDRGRMLFACAPTGIGKTISTLFPSLKAIGEGKGDKIFYLTAKEATRQVASDTVQLLQNHGAVVKSLTLTAKSKICILEKPDCNPESCSRAKGHYDRILKALFSMLSTEYTMTREIVQKYGELYQVCPFELSLEASDWVDIVIGDYNHGLDPVSKLRRFFSEEKNDHILLLDEAHNLLDRAREMFSIEIHKKDFLAARTFFKEKSNDLYKTIGSIQKIFLQKSKDLTSDQEVFDEPPEEFLSLFTHFSALFEAWLKEQQGESPDTVLDLYFSVLAYIRVSEFYDEHYCTLWESQKSDCIVRLFCLDPSTLLKKIFSNNRSSILFSATLLPLSYYFDVLGGKKGEDYQVSFPSPFDSKNLCLLATSFISTRYRDREKSFFTIAETLSAIVSEKTGNYMTYFPSYHYLNSVLELFTMHFPNISVVVQENGMDIASQKDFLLQFKENTKASLLGFSVLGGAFSEGIDLVGDRLIGSIIISPGLPQVSFLQNTLQNYYEKTRKNGFDYAYTYPGLNKVLQAAGRVIRTEQDRGIVVLMDDRFTSSTYLNLFPKHWHHLQFANDLTSLTKSINDFYKTT